MFWKSKKERRNEILEELRQEDKVRQEAEAQLKEAAEKAVREKIDAEEEARKLADETLRASADPWVDIKAIVHDPEKGVQIELDWNEAFIKYLKESGYTGVDEEAIIQKYLIVLTQNIVEGMDDNKASEYE